MVCASNSSVTSTSTTVKSDQELESRIGSRLRAIADRVQDSFLMTRRNGHNSNATGVSDVLYAALRDEINDHPEQSLDDNMEARASKKVNLESDYRIDALHTIHRQVFEGMIIIANCIKAKFGISEAQKKAFKTVESDLDNLDAVSLDGRDWHECVQKILPLFVSLHNKGLFEGEHKLSLFRKCKRIVRTS